MSSNWSRIEVEAIVADYMEMLGDELASRPVNKTQHRRRLLRLLNNRSEGSIERKHQNISAVLVDRRMPYIDGYKPLSNYQALLAEVIDEYVSVDTKIKRHFDESLTRPFRRPRIVDVLSALEDPPEPRAHVESEGAQMRSSTPVYLPFRNIDYVEREERNKRLGKFGEDFVIQFERARLRESGHEKLAEGIEQVSDTKGPSAGYDVRSYETDGSDRLIEVKTTTQGKYMPFCLTKHELDTSIHHSRSYFLYRVFSFKTRPSLFMLPGRVDHSCKLVPVEYACRVG